MGDELLIFIRNDAYDGVNQLVMIGNLQVSVANLLHQVCISVDPNF